MAHIDLLWSLTCFTAGGGGGGGGLGVPPPEMFEESQMH